MKGSRNEGIFSAYRSGSIYRHNSDTIESPIKKASAVAEAFFIGEGKISPVKD